MKRKSTGWIGFIITGGLVLGAGCNRPYMTNPASPFSADTPTSTVTAVVTPDLPTATMTSTETAAVPTPIPIDTFTGTPTSTPVPPQDTPTDTYTDTPTPTFTAPLVTYTFTPSPMPTPPGGMVCPAVITCGTNASGLVAAQGYPAGSPASKSVTCTSENAWLGGVFTATLAPGATDIYTIMLPNFGISACVLLDSFDNGSGANKFTMTADHCLGMDRTGPITTFCGDGVVKMTTTIQPYDTNVTVRVKATQGSGPYRIIIMQN